MAITSSVTPSADPVYVDSAAKNDLGNKDIFLKLLVAQMENQDPLKPQDATAMSSQLAQFNMVEQQTSTNKLLEQLVAASSGSSSGATDFGNAASYLGHSVTVDQTVINFDGTTSQDFNVSMDATSGDSMVFIYDTNGNLVRSMVGSLNAGDNAISWDGLTDSGAIAPSGSYVVGVSALDTSGNEIGYTVQMTGIVEGVRFGPSGTELIVDGRSVLLSDITELRL